jgi:hypothetical protein
MTGAPAQDHLYTVGVLRQETGLSPGSGREFGLVLILRFLRFSGRSNNDHSNVAGMDQRG